MLGIGAVARLGGVSVRTLRYYDEIGLLRPVWTDPNTGYRWYEPQQLHRLHRIVAMRDLGVRLVDIGRLLDDDLSVDELRGILLLRRAEAHDRMAAEAARLARVEARLDQLKEEPMTEYDVVVKHTDPQWVIGITETIADVDDVGDVQGRLWPRLHAILDRLGVDFRPPSIEVERGTGPVALTAALPVPDDVRDPGDGAEAFELPGLQRAATTLMRGGSDYRGAYQAVRDWVAQTGERSTGESREIYLDCDGPRETWVVEIEFALEPRA